MMRAFLITISVFFLCVGPSYPSQAIDPNQRVYRLTLKEATELALNNNFEIQLAKYDTWISRTDRGVAESIYDTVFEGEVIYQDNQRKRTSTIAGTKVVDNDYNIGLSKKLPTGTTLEVDLVNNRNSTNSTFSTSSLTHDSTLGVSIAQELGKNFFGVQDRGNVKITKIEIENTEYTSLKDIEDHIAAIQKAYWDLVLETNRVAIEKTMVEQAKRLYDLHQEKLKDGLVELAEALASEANYKRRQNQLALVENRAATKANTLKLLLNITDDHITLTPAADLTLPETSEELSLALKHAFSNRRDYKKARNEIKAKDIQLAMKQSNIWPEINLSASLERNGLGDHFKQSVTAITNENNPNFLAELTVTMPLENTEARSQLKAAQLQKAKTLLELKFLERKIMTEIVNQVRDCNVFLGLAKNNDTIARLQEQKLNEEQKRFQYGRSDTDTLIRFQEDSIQAQFAAAQAKHQYHTAIVDLRKEEGVLLDMYWKGEI